LVVVIVAIVFAGIAYSKLFDGFTKTPEGEEKDLDWVDVTVEMTDKESASGDYINMASLDETPVVVSSPPDVYVSPEDNDDDAPVLA
jgi:hypothetical protein